MLKRVAKRRRLWRVKWAFKGRHLIRGDDRLRGGQEGVDLTQRNFRIQGDNAFRLLTGPHEGLHRSNVFFIEKIRLSTICLTIFTPVTLKFFTLFFGLFSLLRERHVSFVDSR